MRARSETPGWGIRQVALYVAVVAACLAALALRGPEYAAARVAWHAVAHWLR